MERRCNKPASFSCLRWRFPDWSRVWALSSWVLTMHANTPFTDSLVLPNFAHSACLSFVHYPFDSPKSIWIEWNNFVPIVITTLLVNTPFHVVVSFWHILKDTETPLLPPSPQQTTQQKENNNLKHGNREFYCFPVCHDSENNFIVFTLTSLYLGQIRLKIKSGIIHPVVYLRGFGYNKPNIYRKIAKYLQSGFLYCLKYFQK